jgi:Ca2+/Na+ antiporter
MTHIIYYILLSSILMILVYYIGYLREWSIKRQLGITLFLYYLIVFTYDYSPI